MKTCLLRPLLALALLATVLSSGRPLIRASGVSPVRATLPAATASPVPPSPDTATPTAGRAAPLAAQTAVIQAESALEPCSLAAHRAACDGDAHELAAYGLDIEEVSRWTRFGLRRFVEAVERLADAFGGGAARTRRIDRFWLALGANTDGGRIRVVWQEEPQWRGDTPVRGGYAARRLYFNPNTLFLDIDTPEEVRRRTPQGFWWLFIHELAHLWDEGSAPVARARHSSEMRRWVDAQQAEGTARVYPSSYAVIGGMVEDFAESVAATVTGDSALDSYYGSPRDNFVRAVLCEAVGCRG